MRELLRGYAVTTLCGWSVFPLLHRLLPRLPDRGYSLSRCFGVIMGSWIAWMLAGAAGQPLTTGIAILSIALTLCLTAGAAFGLRPASPAMAIDSSDRFGDFLRRGIRWIIRVEVLFVSGLLVFSWLERHNPAVDPDSERFMDYALLRACLRSGGLPVMDPWFAGKELSYYHFGYAMVAFLVRAAGAEPARFFVTAVSLQHALLWSAVFGAGLALTGRAAGGLAAALLVLGAGNGEWIRQRTWWSGSTPFDWFATSRAIDGAITEVPWFSMLWGDLHPYVIALPVAACALALVMADTPQPVAAEGHSGGTAEAASIRGARAACFAMLTGALLATHPWDFPVIAGVSLAVVLALPGPERGRRLVCTALALGLSGVPFIPFLRGMVRAGAGVGGVVVRTRPGEWITAYLPFVLVGAVSAVLLSGPALRHLRDGGAVPARVRLVVVLAGVGLATAIGCELVYVRDLFESTDLYRMNTVFKLYRLAWLLLGVASAALLVRVRGRHSGRSQGPGLRLAVRLSRALVVASALVYPIWGTAAWMRARDAAADRDENVLAGVAQRPGADAEGLFRALFPGDAEAAGFIASAASPGETLLEETGEPYTWSSRISTFSGVPTVLGWGNHEAVWRQDWREVEERRSDVQAIYEEGDRPRACELARKYAVRWVVVGERERKRYGQGAASGLAVRRAFESRGTSIYDIAEVCGPRAPTVPPVRRR